ncbi:MerR family transcriptional regulator [Streptomyces spiroverticillatus]|uniref:MerR family transcriptional regulator n=1 Tax=Streptomyces finlayi TaxID=67296 RepID=A0A918X205_9ACTN|nr:MerR family transcriptional regulator [Streptomyces finlayi]GHA22904.1 MerR family transcriptional regulator [Streptomyces spiroverticillatus]GHD04665.1 MerR family transcriptional regulator [Streptomyces finlayi]
MSGDGLRTVDVAAASGYSVQQVRNLERLGVLPPAVRAANGYRQYGPLHVRALGAYRALALAAGPVAARRLLTEARSGTLAEAAAAIGEVHTGLARERGETVRAQEALRAIRGEEGTYEEEATYGTDQSDSMTITELAGALRVRPSTLRFWEEEGLVLPERVTSLRARRYGPRAVAAARIVAALRGAGYGVPAVREVMGALDRLDGPGSASYLLGRRLDDIAVRTVALLRAGADLAAVVEAVR